MTKVAVIGIGRMGKGIIWEAVSEGLDVVAAVDSPNNPLSGKDAGIVSGVEELGVKVSSAQDLEGILDKAKPDVVIDFTNAEACFRNFKSVCSKGINLVVGTTGFTDVQLEEMKKEANRSGVGAVISPNMSVGVNVFWEIVKEATPLLEGYDIEIIEKHHRFKKDSPSGTALKTAEVIADARGQNLSDMAIFGRKGVSERKPEEIGIHAVRSGDIVGDHTVLYGTLGERIEITHIAHSRTAFIKGVIKAIKYIKGKKGVYGMNDVLGL